MIEAVVSGETCDSANVFVTFLAREICIWRMALDRAYAISKR